MFCERLTNLPVDMSRDVKLCLISESSATQEDVFKICALTFAANCDRVLYVSELLIIFMELIDFAEDLYGLSFAASVTHQFLETTSTDSVCKPA
jgi:hypothetical protein